MSKVVDMDNNPVEPGDGGDNFTKWAMHVSKSINITNETLKLQNHALFLLSAKVHRLEREQAAKSWLARLAGLIKGN